MKKTVLFYYFGFPHYRRSILTELASDHEFHACFASGTSSRDGVQTLNEMDFPPLNRALTIAIGPFSWDRGVQALAASRDVDIAVMGPAVSSLTTWVVLIHRRIFGRPTFLWGRFGQSGEVSARRVLIGIMARLATGLLVYGERDLDAVVSLGINRRRARIVGNAVQSNATLWSRDDSQRAFERMREAAASAKRDGLLVLAHSGRLTPSKRPEVLLEAIGILKKQFPAVHLHLIGDGPSMQSLKAHRNAGAVTFHGPVYDSDQLRSIIQSATLVTSPLNMGLLAIDALRAGVPVLLPDHPTSGPEVESLAIGVNARKFKAGDAASLCTEATHWVESAELIGNSEYVNARSLALQFWDPAQVARAILAAIRS